MLLALSVMHQQWRKPDPLVPRVFPGARDGLIVLVDTNVREPLWKFGFDSAAGLCFTPSRLYIASMWGNHVTSCDRQLGNLRETANALFNDLHTVTESRSGLLVASSGIDGVLEIDFSGKLLWSWLATDRGFHLISRRSSAVRGLEA